MLPEVTKSINERYPGSNLNEATIRTVLKIFQENLKKTIIESKGKPPKTYSHAHRKIMYHIRIGGIFFTINAQMGEKGKFKDLGSNKIRKRVE